MECHVMALVETPKNVAKEPHDGFFSAAYAHILIKIINILCIDMNSAWCECKGRNIAMGCSCVPAQDLQKSCERRHIKIAVAIN